MIQESKGAILSYNVQQTEIVRKHQQCLAYSRLRSITTEAWISVLRVEIITSWLTFALAVKVKKHLKGRGEPQAFADKFQLSQRAALSQFWHIVNNGVGQ